MFQTFLKAGEVERDAARNYLGDFMVANKDKEIILVLYHQTEHCILIILYPQVCHAIYFDSSKNTEKKDYTHIKSVLDKALFGFNCTGGYIRRKKHKTGLLCFSHNTNLCCVQQPQTSTRDAFYVIHHMQAFIRDEQGLRMPTGADNHLRDWGAKLAEEPDDKLIFEFYRIQQSLATIIMKDVVAKDGMFFVGPQMRDDAETRIHLQAHAFQKAR